MSDDVPFAIRRRALIDRAVEIFSVDSRLAAGWLEGSLADGSADSYSDIDLHLCVDDASWEEVWRERRGIVERLAPILAATEIMGAFAVAFLMQGPVKLDVFFERRSNVGAPRRIAVKRLWGSDEFYNQFKIGDDLGRSAVARALEYSVLGFLQGATWPVRLLARGQVNTFLLGEIMLIETGIVPLMLLERDPRTFHRNMFTRAKMLTQSEHRDYARLTDRAMESVRKGDRAAMRDASIEIMREFCRLARAAFARFELQFPPRVEDEMVAFFEREWPLK